MITKNMIDEYQSLPSITLRDYFAGQVIIPFMTWSLDQSQEDGDTAAIAAKRYAKSAYLIADAMLEARK